MLITGQSGQAPLRYLASHKAGYRRFGYMLALLSGVSLVAGVGSVARADDGASVSSGDMTNTQTRNLPQGTEVKGDLYQKDGQLGLDGTSVAGTLHLDGGTAIFGHNGASHRGTLVQSLAGSADAVLDKADDNHNYIMTPSPDPSAPYQGELTITQGKGETYGGSLKGTGVLSLLSGTQVLTGQNQINGTVDIRNGTLILRDKGTFFTEKGSPRGPLDVGLARGNEGHLVLEGPDARIQRMSVFIGNGDPTYGGGSGPIGKSDATLTDGAQINNRTNEGMYVVVGNDQNGELNVENGSRVEADEFYAAASQSLTGTVNVTGSGSAVEATNAHIGNEGTGVVNISDGASFRADEARFGEDGGNGSLVVGVDGTMQNGNTIIGAGGKGTVTVDGGRFQNDGTIRFGVPGTGAASDGTLNVLDHGVLVAGDDGSSPAIAAEDGAKAAINLDAATIRNIQGRDFTSTVAANLTGMNEFNVQDSNTMSWKGGLTGDGGVDKTGTGTLGLSGNLAYKGMTNVEAGTLSVTDATLSGQVINQTNGTYVQKGGELDGTLANIGTASVDHTNVKGVVTNNSSFTATDSTLANLVNLGGNATLRNTLVHEVTSTEKSVLDFKDTVVDGRFANTGKVLAVHSKVPGLPSAADSESNSDVLAGRSGDSGATITNRMGDEDDLTNRAGSVPRKGNFTNGGDAEFYDSELATFTNTGTFLLAQKSVVNGDILQNDGKLTLDDSQVNGVLFARGGTFDITSGGASVESLAGRANGQLEGTLNLTKAADTYAGNISGNGGLTISGGRETLAGNNTYTGETDVTQNGGLTLKGSLASALNNAGTTDITGGRVAGTTTNSGTLTASKATLADVTNESGGTFSAAGGQLDSVVNNGNMTLDQGVIVHGSIAQHAGDLMLDGSKTKGVLAAHGGQLTIGNNGFTAGSLEGSGNAQLEGTLNLTDASSTYAGSMGGNGGLTVSGGHEVLTGNNSYSGNTLVQTGGQLDVNGDNSAAKGLTSVTDGATLRGTGTIGGDVNIGSGGTLAAGTAEAPSTLTVNGSLNLADGSRQVFRLGQADTEGGAYNDFINVKGNLALGGTLSIQPVDAGPDVNNSSLMAGLYRLYSYGGVLSGTQQSVDVASKPLPEGMVVQTSIDHQVNLAVNTGGFNYWDGGSSAHRSDDGRGNGRIDGGDGVWTAARPQGTPSWATADGSANGQWQNGNMAIFAASAGTVHVNDKAEDGTQAPVIFSGAQFANLDGKNYLVTGDNLYASTGKTVIRVGDGTSSGKDITAEIASVIDGSKVDGGTGLEKTDLGTLILSSDNDFAKPTHVEAGTLQLGNGGTTGSVGQQDIVNDGTLAVDHSNDVTLGQTISGTGSFVQKGQGTTTLSGANSYTGDTDVQNGRLNLTGSLAGKLNNAAATDVNGGKVAGTTTNTGTLTAQNATLADVANQAGTASLADSTAGHVTNADGATFKAAGGTLASADNSGSMTLGAGNHVTGDVTNSKGDLTLDGNQIAGTTANHGQLTAQNATLADVANQAGTASLADSTAGHVTNADGATFKATGGTLASADNSGSMTLGAGNHVTGDVTNSRGDLTLDGNQIAGTTANHGQLTAQNATLADVANQAGTASLADSTAGHVTNADGATFKATGGTLASADNSGSMTLGAGNHVTGDVTNSRGDLTLDGNQIAGTTANHGQLAAQNATLADVANQAGTASLADSTAGHVTNADGATFKATGGTLASADNSGSMTLGAGNHVTGDVTNSRGDLTLDGNQIAGTTANHGQLTAQNATLADVANQAGTASLADSTAGHVTNADGATFKATGGTLASADNSGSMTLGAGNHVTGDVTNSKGDLTLDGNQIAGTLAANGGSFSVTDHGSDAGSLAGSGNGVLNGTLTLTNAKDTYAGSLSGNGGLTLSGGHETLTDQSHLGGPVSVAGGTLALAGAKAQLTTDSSVKIGAGKAGDVSLSDGAALHSHGPVVFAKAETAPADGTDARLDVLSGSRLSAGDVDGKPGLVAEEGAKAQLTLDGGTLQNIKGSDLTSNVNTAIGSKGAVFDVQDENRMTLGNNVVLTDDGSAGDHALTKTGTGVLTFAGDGSGFNGPTDIQSGDMIVDGNMSHSAMTVQHGAVLAGNGSVGSTVVSSGGMLGAGNETDAGALHVMGDLTMAKGSVLSIRGSNEATGRQLVAPDGFSYSELKSDQVLVSGKADLQGGTLALKVKDPTALKYGQAYHVLTANGGVNGHYDDLETNIGQDYAYLDPRLVYQGNDVDVMLRRSIHGFEYVGQTRNEIAAGEGLNHISENSDLAKAMTVLTKDQARHALNNLSGELHASIRTGLIQDSFYIRNAALNRLAAADCDYGHNGQSFYDLKTRRKDGACYSDHAVLWGQAYGGMGFNSGDGNAALMHHNTAGFVIGADGPINHSNWRVGGLISYGHSQFNVQRGRSSSANSNNISIGAYAGTHWGRLNLRFGAIYSWNVINTHRHVAVGDYGGRLSSSYLGGTAQGFGELGYKFRGERSMFEPFMNVAYVNMQSDSYREHGNEAALHSHGTDTGVTFSSFGFRTATTVGIGKAVFMPHLSAAYRHAFGRTGSRQRETFAMGSGAGDMDVAGVLLSRNAAVVQAGVTARVSERVDLDLSYIGQYGNQSTESGGTGSVKVRF
ncbi:hypothetical protein GM608_01885 [Bombella sp. ESL0380]|uniref:autotransporter domain-containing protein n=1 Tax=Bombella sp. ESL0380 TaxID=2676444 RepID=UPI00139D0590|nr:hypothetical protein [Bombella sp. ESL0380]